MRFAFSRLSFLGHALGFERTLTKREVHRNRCHLRLELLEDRTLLSPSNLSLSVNPGTINENGSTTLSGSFTDSGVLADSVNDFSLTQGQGNWYYGYYTTPRVSSTFTQMLYTSQNVDGFAGPGWQESQTQPPWTGIWAQGAHPNGPNDIAVHWAVRRWLSTASGSVTISGLVGDSGTPSFNVDGLTCDILVNGTQVFSQHEDAGTEQAYSTTATVAAGDFVDFAIDPGMTDFSDHGIFTATISEQQQSYQVAINWGDKLSDTVNLAPGVLSFSLAHQYLDNQPNNAPYTVAATVTDSYGLSTSAAASVTVDNVAPANVSVSVTSGTEGSPVTASGSFTDPGTLDSHMVAVNWGDGLSDTLSLAAGVLSFSGLTHQYAEEQVGNTPYTVTATVTDSDGASGSGTTSATVADAALSAAGTPITATQGIPLSSVQLATFTDANPAGTASDFTATINWGDGTLFSSGTIAQSGTTFVVQGSHTYASAGPETATVTITDVGGQTATATASVTVVQSIYVLNDTADSALDLSGDSSINISGSVLVDSNSATALSASGNAQITASSIQVVGGFQISGNASFSVPPSTVMAVADPLSQLVAPDPSTLTNYIALGLGQVLLTGGSQTLNPGIYRSIDVSGDASLSLNPGIYLIEGGGFTVTGSASVTVATGPNVPLDPVTGPGVLIYNAGSNFPDTGGDMGGITLTADGSISLTAAPAGPYAGVAIYQARDNTRAISLGGNASTGISGVIYARNTQLNMTGHAQLQAPLVVGTLHLRGSAGLAQTAAGSDGTGDTSGIADTLLAGNLSVYINDPGGDFSADQLARIQDAIQGLDNLLGPYSVTIAEVSDPSVANLVLDAGTSSACGGADDGVLGCYNQATHEITIIEGWDWYAGADPNEIHPHQYDFQTTVTHELGHALGLGGATDPNSPMHETLAMGETHRTMTVPDLNIPEAPTGADALRAAPSGVGEQQALRTPDPRPLARGGPAVSFTVTARTQPAASLGGTIGSLGAPTPSRSPRPAIAGNVGPDSGTTGDTTVPDDLGHGIREVVPIWHDPETVSQSKAMADPSPAWHARVLDRLTQIDPAWAEAYAPRQLAILQWADGSPAPVDCGTTPEARAGMAALAAALFAAYSFSEPRRAEHAPSRQ